MSLYACDICHLVEDDEIEASFPKSESPDGWLEIHYAHHGLAARVCPLCALNEGLVDPVEQPYVALKMNPYTEKALVANHHSTVDRYGNASAPPQSDFTRWINSSWVIESP